MNRLSRIPSNLNGSTQKLWTKSLILKFTVHPLRSIASRCWLLSNRLHMYRAGTWARANFFGESYLAWLIGRQLAILSSPLQVDLAASNCTDQFCNGLRTPESCVSE